MERVRMRTGEAEAMGEGTDNARVERDSQAANDATSRSDRVLKQVPAPPAQVATPVVRASDAYLEKELERAQCLLAYAAEAGIDIDDAVRRAVLCCRDAAQTGWDDDRAAGLLSALTKIAITVHPVTKESLDATDSVAEAERKGRLYKRSMFWLFTILVPFSLGTFCTSRLSEAIQKDLDAAQALAVKVNDELYGPGSEGSVTTREAVHTFARGTTQLSVIQDLTQFAQAVRAIDADARKLNMFVFWMEAEPFPTTPEGRKNLELVPGLTNLPAIADHEVEVFQRVRLFAQSAQKDVAVWYGAVASCILPMLYALLGALAYLLRSFEQQLETRTLRHADGHAARFTIAAIGGFVVGLFNVSVEQSATISPLALAFLVGYAVDVFFSFLQGLILTFGRVRADGAPPGAAGAKPKS
jgi:hypothetical protein